MTNDELILICAVRYALGRMSYVVGEVCDYVKSKRNGLSRNCIDTIIRDIEGEIVHYRNSGFTLGMECDERDWLNLLEVLKNENNSTER